MDDYIIKLSNADHFRTTEWKMTIDIRTLSEGMLLPRAKKLLKLIREYGTEEDFGKVERNLKNKKLLQYWRAITLEDEWKVRS